MGSFTRLKGTPLAVAAAVGGFLCAGTLAGCAGGGSAGKIPRPLDTPLAYLAGRPAVVLPVQPNFSFPDSTSKQPEWLTAQFIAAIDDSIDYSAEPMTLVEFRLEEIPGGTLLTISESGFDAIPAARRAAAFRGNDSGWTGQAKNIARYVTSNP
jgi:hypothetical protein